MIMRKADAQRLLALYLRDHHAAGTAGSLTVDRVARNVTLGQDARKELAEIAAEIKTDLRTLEEIMTTANIAQSAVKDALARTGAALGSLKPNGRVRTRSPLSDVIELETMLAGVTAKAALWTTLKALRLRTPVDFDELGARANKQSATLSRWRDAAAENALGRRTNEPASQPPAG